MSLSSVRIWKIRDIRPCAGPGDSCRFTVTLVCGDDCIPDVKLEAGELLDYPAFRERILKTSGRLIRFTAIESSADPAAAWIDLVETTLAGDSVRKPASGFFPSPPPPRGHSMDGAAHEMTEIGGGD
jgi:hypothetical protein